MLALGPLLLDDDQRAVDRRWLRFTEEPLNLAEIGCEDKHRREQCLSGDTTNSPTRAVPEVLSGAVFHDAVVSLNTLAQHGVDGVPLVGPVPEVLNPPQTECLLDADRRL